MRFSEDLIPLRRRSAYFSSVVTFCCGSVRATETAQFLDFNIALMLIAFILSEKWLERRAKQSIGDAIASLLALQAPTALLVEENGVLVEREVDANLLLECIASYLVLSGTNYAILIQTMTNILHLVVFDRPTALDLKSSSIAPYLVFRTRRAATRPWSKL